MSFFRAIGLSVAIIFISGCAKSNHPYRVVQLCLANSNEIPAFMGIMHEIASEYDMQFYDQSGELHEKWRSLASDGGEVPLNDRAVNIRGEHGDDFSFGAGNLGMATNHIFIGFNGKDSDATKSLAKNAAIRLSERWNVHEVAAHSVAPQRFSCA